MYIIRYILFCVAYFYISVGLSSQSNADFSPKRLNYSENVKIISLLDSNKELIDVGAPCSLTEVGEDYIIFANYINLYLVDKNTGLTKLLTKPKGIDIWVPTGVKWSQKNQLLYLANYKGHDILLLKLNAQQELELVKRHTDPDLKGPENIDILEEQNLFAVADYDGSKVFLFNDNGKIWSHDVGSAHGVSFNKIDKSIYATGLGPPKIYHFDLKGKLLSQQGEPGWGKNGYLWPTCITVKDNNITVSDAHTGKITFLNSSMEPMYSLGGNGVGVDLFNMPYAIEFQKNNLFYLTDTFKGRILTISHLNGQIVTIYQGKTSGLNQLAAALAQPDFKPKYAKATKFAKENTVKNKDILGLSYKVRKNLISPVRIKLDHFSKDLESEKWHFLYNGFSGANTGKFLALVASHPLYSTSQYYWTLARPYKYKDHEFLIIGSPEVKEWLVLYDGIVCPIEVGLDFWIEKNSLLNSSGERVLFRSLAKIALEKIKAYRSDVNKGKLPLEAMSNHLLGTDSFYERLSFSLQTEKGKKMLECLKNATTIEQQTQAANEYMDSIQNDNPLYFTEIAVASTILKGKNSRFSFFGL